MPWFEFSLNGTRRLAYGKRAHFAVARVLEDLDEEGVLNVRNDDDLWLAIRRLTSKEERRMSECDKNSVHDISALEVIS